MPLHRLIDQFDFPGQRRIVNAGAAPGPVGRAAAKECRTERRGGGGVADAHLTQRQHIDIILDRHHAVGHGAHAVFFGHGGRFAEIRGGFLQRHFINPKVGIAQRAELIHRRTAVNEVGHHLLGHLGGIG